MSNVYADNLTVSGQSQFGYPSPRAFFQAEGFFFNFRMGLASLLSWTPDITASGTADLAIARNGVGILRVLAPTTSADATLQVGSIECNQPVELPVLSLEPANAPACASREYMLSDTVSGLQLIGVISLPSHTARQVSVHAIGTSIAHVLEGDQTKNEGYFETTVRSRGIGKVYGTVSGSTFHLYASGVVGPQRVSARVSVLTVSG